MAIAPKGRQNLGQAEVGWVQFGSSKGLFMLKSSSSVA